jgi:predicted DNA-binding transcriptional regulator AlpA
MAAQFAPRFIKTPDALIYLAVGRTRFYRLAGELDIKPAHASGNTSLWRRTDIERIGDYLEGVEHADAAA